MPYDNGTATRCLHHRKEGVKPLSITLKNRREAYDKIKSQRDNRKSVILSALRDGDPNGMTAEEIAQKLVESGEITHFDMNFVRPRLTEMKESNDVKVVGRRPSVLTGRNTSVWKAVKT